MKIQIKDCPFGREEFSEILEKILARPLKLKINISSPGRTLSVPISPAQRGGGFQIIKQKQKYPHERGGHLFSNFGRQQKSK